MVRDATGEDWPAIWSFMRRVVAAGETFSYDQEMNEVEAREIWLSHAPARTMVAVEPDHCVSTRWSGLAARAIGRCSSTRWRSVATMHTAHPDLRFTIDDLVAEADRVVVRWTLHATNRARCSAGHPPASRSNWPPS